MAETSVLISGIEHKVQQLIARNNQLNKKVKDLTDENEALKSELAELQQSYSQLTDQLNKKIIVNALEGEKELEEGRKLIQELMREIDHCVALLNKG
jgi:predicted RNase H-like nuclease (RuvC/YqgF family)